MSRLTPEQIDVRLTEFVGQCMILTEDLAAYYRETGHPALVPAAALVAQAGNILHSQAEDERLDRLEAESPIADDLRTLTEEVDRG